MGTTEWKTDATFGFVKALGNRQGPHALASELVATSLAAWFDLTVAEYAVLDLPADACYDLPHGARTEPGPAFVSRKMDGRTWGGAEEDLTTLGNPADITRLVVCDTWVRNCDRHPPDLTARRPNLANVFLKYADKSDRLVLTAIDHTHCFDGGSDWSPKLDHIDRWRDDRTYGLFPAFARFLQIDTLPWCAAHLRTLTGPIVDAILNRIPVDWQVSLGVQSALANLILRRATYLADRIENGWWPANPTTEESQL